MSMSRPERTSIFRVAVAPTAGGSAPSARDGLISAASPRKTLALGYQLTTNLSVAGFLDHMSNASLAAHNAGLTDAGARFGFKL